MRLYFLVALILHASLLFAQHRPLDQQAFNDWPDITSEKLSDDGAFVSYSVQDPEKAPHLTVQATDSSWSEAFITTDRGAFTDDSKYFICKEGTDSLGILSLDGKMLTVVPNVRSYKVGGQHRLAYWSKSEPGTLTVVDLVTGKEKQFPAVSDYYFNETGDVLVITTKEQPTATRYDLIRVDLATENEDTIMRKCGKVSHLIFDRTGAQAALLLENPTSRQAPPMLAYFRLGMASARIIADSVAKGMKGYVIVGDNIRFSRDGDKLFFKVRIDPGQLPIPKKTAPQVDIWSYKDKSLQSEQLYELTKKLRKSIIALVNLTGSDTTVICQRENDGILPKFPALSDDDYILNENTGGSSNEQYWNPTSRSSIYLTATKDGNRRLLRSNVITIGIGSEGAFSPMGHFILFFDETSNKYLSYNTETGTTRPIACNIAVPLSDQKKYPAALPEAYWIAGWIDNDSTVLIYDKYDIWKVDLTGKTMPVNVTNGFGRRNKIVFRVLNVDKVSLFKSGERLLLSAFGERDKYNGFFQIEPGKPCNPEKLTFGPCAYYFASTTASLERVVNPFLPLKARDTRTYLVARMSPSEYPNLYITTDFKTFRQLTGFAPQQNYNWLTSELIHWTLPDGKSEEGILYKPQDFDSRRKYPMIVHPYERFSENLYKYIFPGLMEADINVPWFVSHGYLVFLPDIHYKKGLTGESAFNSVISGTQYLSRLPWVDKDHIGLQGHSFGGYEANYILTRANLFAAAESGGGICDLTSAEFSIAYGGGTFYAGYIESGQNRMGGTTWEKPDLYHINSPIFYANHVSTPLLIMFNREDGNVPWEQGVEWFTALRRLGKKAWMLQYDGEPHVLLYDQDKIDFSTRLFQFFDHYLKGAAAPKWMTDGVPAEKKGLDSGLELK